MVYFNRGNTMFKERREQKLAIKLLLCLLYLIVITILFVASYSIYKSNNNIISFNKVKKTNDYSYIKASYMSDKFAYYKESNIGIHYVKEIEETGKWHIYIVAINEDNISKYQKLIDYSNGKIKEEVKPIKLYGYPVLTNDKLKELTIKHINEVLPKENEVVINNDNYNYYLTNCYLDTTQVKSEDFNPILFISLLLILIMIFLMIYTFSDNNKIVKRIDHYIERYKKKIKRIKNKFKKPNINK